MWLEFCYHKASKEIVPYRSKKKSLKRPLCKSQCVVQPHAVTFFLDLEGIYRFTHAFKELLSISWVPGTRVGERDGDEPLAREASRPVGKTDTNQQFDIIIERLM